MTAYWPGIPPAAVIPRYGAMMLGLSLFQPRWCDVDRHVRRLLLIGLLWAAISFCWAADQATALYELGLLSVLLCVALISSSFLSLDGIMKGLAIGLSVSATIVVAQWWGWQGLPEVSSPSGLFYNKDLLAEAAAPVFVWLLIGRRLGFAAILGLTIALCSSRTAVLSIGFGLIYWWCRMLCLALFAAVAAYLILGMIPERVSSAHDRMNTWVKGYQLLTWRGYGIGFYRAAVPQGQLIHSDTIQMAGELGVGVVPFLLAPILMWWKARDERWSAEWCAFATILLESAVSFPLHQAGASFVAAVLAGFLARRRYRLYVERDLSRDIGRTEFREYAASAAGAD
jgi:hypothetical protein